MESESRNYNKLKRTTLHGMRINRFAVEMSKRKLKNRNETGRSNGHTATIHNFTEYEKKQFRLSLLDWYNKNKRDLPWRKLAEHPDINRRAYAVWVSEIMLQQTQVATVISYFNKWMEKWPTVQDLAQTNIEAVNEMWSGLGYYSRGRRLFEGAKKVVEELDGEMPNTAEKLLKLLPGVGPYTAGAIASIAFNEVTGLVDGNVIRVLCRMRMIGSYSTNQHVMDQLWSNANSIVDEENPGDFNQGLMELGATVCTPKSPACDKCPVQSLCLSYAKTELEKKKSSMKLSVSTNNNENIQDIECLMDDCKLCFEEDESWDTSLGVENFPRKGKKKAAREERTAVCIVCQQLQENRKYLIVQRPKKGLLAGLWEFPSQIFEANSDEIRANQVLDNACGLSVKTFNQKMYIGEVVHIFSHIHQTYVIDSVTVDENFIDLSDCDRPVKWVTKDEFLEGGTSTAMKKVFKAYENKLSSKGSVKKTPAKLAKIDNHQKTISSFFKPK